MDKFMHIYRAYAKVILTVIDTYDCDPFSPNEPNVVNVEYFMAPVYANENESLFVAKIHGKDNVHVVWHECTECWYGLLNLALNDEGDE